MPVTLPRRPIFSTQKMRHLLFQLLMGMLGAVILALFFHLFHLLHSPKQVATVDVTSMINHFVKSAADAKLPPEQLQKKVNAFGQALDNTLKKVARDQRLILLPKEAVIAGTKDISDEIEATLNAQFTAFNAPSHQP